MVRGPGAVIRGSSWLLALPLLFYHFERSPRALWVFVAFLASCILLMAASWVVAFDPNFTLKPEAAGRGIFVKNYIDQSQEIALCAVAIRRVDFFVAQSRMYWVCIGLESGFDDHRNNL